MLQPVVVLGSGCSGSNNNGGGGTGGSAGSAGSGGSGGGMGGSSGACAAPACITDLIKDCTPVGSCTQQKPDGGMGLNSTCWANGVKSCGGAVNMSGSNVSTTITFYKSDGKTICFTEDLTGMVSATDGGNNGPSELMITIKNAAGTTVATGSVKINNGQDGGNSVPVTVMCGGESYTFDGDTCNGFSGKASDGSDCTNGACTCG